MLQRNSDFIVWQRWAWACPRRHEGVLAGTRSSLVGGFPRQGRLVADTPAPTVGKEGALVLKQRSKTTHPIIKAREAHQSPALSRVKTFRGGVMTTMPRMLTKSPTDQESQDVEPLRGWLMTSMTTMPTVGC